VSVARFIADQRTNYRVPHTITCLLLGVSLAWFYKWRARTSDTAAAAAGRGRRRRGGHVRRCERVPWFAPAARDLRDAGWMVTEKTVADSMRRQGLSPESQAQKGIDRARQDAPKFPDLVNRDFTAAAPNLKWCGDITEIPTATGSCIWRR
jgi:transposase InsO family protein